MSFETEERPEEIDFFVASLCDGLSVPVGEHWHWEERVDWLTVADDLPKGEGDGSSSGWRPQGAQCERKRIGGSADGFK